MAEGVDYSYSRPSISCLRNAGKKFVVRYIGAGTSSKYATRSEVDALIGAGMSVGLVYQTTATFMISSFANGQHAGTIAKQRAAALGCPTNRPIYFALDTDPNPLTRTQIAQVRAYLDGVASVLGRHRVGIYGGYRAIELFCPASAPWGWQSLAWSYKRWSSKAQFQQYTPGRPLCGGQVDLNRNIAVDFGQWPLRGTTPSLPMDPVDSTLKIGSVGPRVLELQKMLQKLGYVITLDGKFGLATNHVVVDFQKKHGLTVDGKVGPKTWAALVAATAAKPAPLPAPVPVPAPPKPPAKKGKSMFLIKGDGPTSGWYVTDFITKRWIATQRDADIIIWMTTADGNPIHHEAHNQPSILPQTFVDRIPEVK